MKEERARSLEEVNAYTVAKEKLKKVLLEEKVAMKAVKRSLMNLESDLIFLKTGNSLLMKKNEELLLAL